MPRHSCSKVLHSCPHLSTTPACSGNTTPQFMWGTRLGTASAKTSWSTVIHALTSTALSHLPITSSWALSLALFQGGLDHLDTLSTMPVTSSNSPDTSPQVDWAVVTDTVWHALSSMPWVTSGSSPWVEPPQLDLTVGTASACAPLPLRCKLSSGSSPACLAPAVKDNPLVLEVIAASQAKGSDLQGWHLGMWALRGALVTKAPTKQPRSWLGLLRHGFFPIVSSLGPLAPP